MLIPIASLELHLAAIQLEGKCSRYWELGRITTEEQFHQVPLRAPGGELVCHEWHECPVCGNKTLDGYRPWNEETGQWSGTWWSYEHVFGPQGGEQ